LTSGSSKPSSQSFAPPPRRLGLFCIINTPKPLKAGLHPFKKAKKKETIRVSYLSRTALPDKTPP
jgi:hypothetical protein